MPVPDPRRRGDNRIRSKDQYEGAHQFYHPLTHIACPNIVCRQFTTWGRGGLPPGCGGQPGEAGDRSGIQIA